MLISLDLETTCNLDGCTDSDCSHGLIPHLARITAIGAYWRDTAVDGVVGCNAHFNTVGELRDFLYSCPEYMLVGHQLKFDLKMLRFHGLSIPLDRWAHDTMLMASASPNKIPSAWLDKYDAQRTIENAKFGQRSPHRKAGQHSLKTLAPYFLKAEPFWEGLDHADAEYVYKDVRYTYELYEFFDKKLRDEGAYEFYSDWLMPKAKMLLEAEIAGIALDFDALNKAEVEASAKAKELKAALDDMWAPAYRARQDMKAAELISHYEEKRLADLAKMKDRTAEKETKRRAYYAKLLDAALTKIEPFSMDSPTQLAWLLRDYRGFDITTYEGEESTGKEVLQRLAAEGHKDVATFYAYRKEQKLCSAFFPSYREMQNNGRLHCNFNPGIARTERLTSDLPNLQQCPAHLHNLFVADPGQVLITRDLSGIEPVVLAYYSEDPVLCDLLMKGENFHNHNVRVMLGVDEPDDVIKTKYERERKVIKLVGLSLCYGSGWKRIQAEGVKAGFRWSAAMCKDMVSRFKERFERVFEYREELNDVLRHGPMTSLFGRQFIIELEEDLHLKGLNTLIQQSASDLLLNSAERVNSEFRAKSIAGGCRLFVHDELVAAADKTKQAEAELIVERCMTDYTLVTPYGKLPLKVEGKTGRTWEK